MTAGTPDDRLDADALTEAVSLAFGMSLLAMEPTETGVALAPEPTDLRTRVARLAWCTALASHAADVIAEHYRAELLDRSAAKLPRRKA